MSSTLSQPSLPLQPTHKEVGPILVIGLDPGESMGWASLLWNPHGFISLLGAGTIQKLSLHSEQQIAVALLGATSGHQKVIFVLEDMPSMMFKSRRAGEGFATARARLKQAVRFVRPHLTFCRTHDMHVQTWRKILGHKLYTFRVPKKKMKKDGEVFYAADNKAASRLLVRDRFGVEIRNNDTAEAVAIGLAFCDGMLEPRIPRNLQRSKRPATAPAGLKPLHLKPPKTAG